MSGFGLYGWAAALTPALSQREREEFRYCPLSLWERAGVRARPCPSALTRSKAP